MLNKIKLGLLVWGTVFLLICFFVTIVVWFICSLWWLLTNNMVDRNLFFLLSLGISILFSVCMVLLGLLPEKNKNHLSI
tara:strand:- start:59 stop:295 length:237 start_codon:yes stop_codon:yes gene_type:complete